MKTSDIFPSKWLSAADLADQNLTLTITDAALETVGEEEKLVIYFKEVDKGLVLNKTNCTTLAGCYGLETDDWLGCQIVLFPTTVNFQGRQVEAIRVHDKRTKQLAAVASKRKVGTYAARLEHPHAQPARTQPVTQAEADEDDIPF